MTSLRQALRDYLQIRRALGYKLANAGWMLPHFVDYLDANGADTVTLELALEWATPSDISPASWQRRLIEVRGFARYLQTIDPQTEVPPTDILPSVARRPAPHIYSDAQIAALMTAAANWKTVMNRATLTTTIGLLAATGMRISEAVGVDRSDLDLTHARLVVRNTKFGKSRQLPLHPSTIQALEDYLAVRDRLHPDVQTPALLLSSTGLRMSVRYVQRQFAQLRDRAGLTARPGARPPRLHDLRHTFAVRTMLDSYRTDGDPQARLAQLATYLGHADPAASYWYLSAVPELLGLAATRLQTHLQAGAPR